MNAPAGWRYGYDNLNRVTVMDRGVLSLDNTTIDLPLDHPVLNSNQQWADLDRRGNWLDYRWAESPAGTPVPHQQTRTVNGVNEHPLIDQDGPEGSQEPTVLAYDHAGNLTLNPLAPNVGPSAPAGQWYGYDEENRVTAVYRTNGTPEHGDDTLLAEYEYDALGRRVSSVEYIDAETGAPLATPKRTRHVYVGLETVEEYDVEVATETLAREFLWGDPGQFPEPLAMVDYTDAGQAAGTCSTGVPPVGCVYHYLHDALGSVVGLTDSTGELVERYTYDPYGQSLIERLTANGYQLTASSAFGNPWMWTGQRYEPVTGLYSFLFRTYSPSLGRWLQRDPAGYVDRFLNLYQYVAATPLFWVDRLGLVPAYDEYENGDPRFNDDERAIWKESGPLEKLAWYKSTQEAFEAVKGSEYDGTRHNGCGDAVRHCVWNCEMTRRMDKQRAKRRADAHEPKECPTEQEKKEKEMDLHNNEVGRELAEEGKEENQILDESGQTITTYTKSCKELCEKALKDGKLRVLDPPPPG